MAEAKRRSSWMVPAVIGACILLFIAIALVAGSLSRPGAKSDPSSPKSPANGAAATSGVSRAASSLRIG